ncbi:flagellar basal body-associated protein FliL [Sinimarinibacterium sp. NLF-5-8]|uniref:flagellar basal body-associated FliL family protein n=1 Tax=Sinimarinibacterium sp. NLF-5-8 TaxID=2698684 RepID=UPI00137B9C78|nr:flagellar basal body-associated FliL family protein [Sinimarinibacterium sp. NLF-5-8]QHS09246.1 flagellar basal body protein FliL [Sinimarinibacterium sp. NLF-5-8]
MATDAKKAKPETSATAKKGGGIVIALISVLFAVAAGAGTSWFMGQQLMARLPADAAEAVASAKPEKPLLPANYVPLDPAFVVNLEDERLQRFLQLQIQVMTRDPKTVEALQHHMPRIRSQLLLLLGQQHASDLIDRAGKERLQAAVLEEIRGILQAETGSADVEGVYFTSFVMQ